MRLIAMFVVGLLSCFFLSELYSRLNKNPRHGLIGVITLVVSIATLIVGRFILPAPLDVLIGILLLGAGFGLVFHHLMSQRFIINKKVETNWAIEHQHGINRALEILPGLLTWIALTSPIWLSFTLPFALAYLIIIADIYWLYSALRLSIILLIGYRKLNYAKQQPWLENLKKDFPNDWDRYYHLILIPTYNESAEIVGPAIDAIVNSNYPKDKILLGIGFESHAKPEITEEVKQHLKQYESQIGGVFTTTHILQPGEMRGPGSNRNWMVRNILQSLHKKHIDPKDVIATTLDADFVIHPEFLSGALHKYLSTPAKIRDKRSYTGVFLYYNNYWQAPAPMRLIAIGTAFWQLSEMVSSDKYMNFASMSINLKSLVDIGLWMGDKVNDDSGFFWKAYFHFKGDYKVLPHFLPITADAVLDTTLVKTFQNQYLQLKRWAYGVEHIPYIFTNYFQSKDLDFWDKTDKLLFALWGYLRWGMLALFVTFAGFFLPLLNQKYNESVLAINLPIISSWMLTIAFFGLLSTIFVHEKTSPPRPKNWNFFQTVWSYIQWLLLPIIMVSISTMPAIDAQTSLMFGRYLKFRVTNKARAVKS